MDPKRQEEERKKIMQKYGISPKKPDEQRTSKYMEYRMQEKLREEKIKNPEKFESKPEEKIEVNQEPTLEPIAEQKKKSWFSKLFKK